MKIYEVVDVTNEDTYFTLGLWLTLEDAVAVIEREDHPWKFESNNDYVVEGFCLIEIRERKIGWWDQGKCKAKVRYDCDYDGSGDGYIWERGEIEYTEELESEAK